MIGIVLEGEAAAEERRRLLEDGKEIPVSARMRDARGKSTTMCLSLGMNASTAWLFFREEHRGEAPRVSMEAALAHEAEAFFSSRIESLHLRKCLVNPSPLSPEMFEIQPCLAEVIEALRAEFGLRITSPLQ